MTGGVNFMLPQGNLKNVDNIFRKAIPSSRYLGQCCCGWGTTSLKLTRAELSRRLGGPMVDADGGRGQEQLGPVLESSCNGFQLSRIPGA